MAVRDQDMLGAVPLESAPAVRIGSTWLLGQSDLFDGIVHSRRVEPVLVREITLIWPRGTPLERIRGVMRHWQSYSGRRGKAFTFTIPGTAESVLAVYGDRAPSFEVTLGEGSATVTVLTVFTTQE